MDLKLAGKVGRITGSSRGIGLASAKAFAAEGCRIMLSARSAEQLREAEAALRRTGAGIAAHAADVSDPDEAARPDDLKFQSSMTLFASAAGDPASVYYKALDKWCNGTLDPRTLKLLE